MKLVLLLTFAALCASHYCPPRHYWSKSLDKCLECRICHKTTKPCTANTNTVCASVHEPTHHFQRNRIRFFDDTDDEEMHSKNFVNNDEIYFPFEKDHHEKYMKHSKSKHEEKHNHHKAKKHFEFKYDDDDDEDINSDPYMDYDRFAKPKEKKHKKHFEFNKHDKKHDDDVFISEEDDNEKHSTFGSRKDKHQVTHLKKVNSDEQKLEEWLIQSKKKLKLRKYDLLKTLKEESENDNRMNVENDNEKKTIRLNSPINELENLDSNVKMIKKKDIHSSEINLLNEFKDRKELESLMEKNKESYRPSKPTHRLYLGEPSSVSKIIGQVKDPQDIIRDEMGKNVLYEKPRFNVIPFVASKEPQTLAGGEVVSLPFTAAETLVWDWQAVAVVSAVASCLVFFSVLAIYFVINTRLWKKSNKKYNKEIEEMSTRIALIHPTIESVNPDSHTTSLYLEKITAHGKEEDQKANKEIK